MKFWHNGDYDGTVAHQAAFRAVLKMALQGEKTMIKVRRGRYCQTRTLKIFLQRNPSRPNVPAVPVPTLQPYTMFKVSHRVEMGIKVREKVVRWTFFTKEYGPGGNDSMVSRLNANNDFVMSNIEI